MIPAYGIFETQPLVPGIPHVYRVEFEALPALMRGWCD